MQAIDLAGASPKQLDAARLKLRLQLCADDFKFFLQFCETEEGPLPFWPFQEEPVQYVNDGQSFIWLKRRQIMASWLIAAAALWVAGFHNYHHVALFSKDEDEALELIRRIKVINLRLPEWLRRRLTGTRPVKFADTRSEITPFAATVASGVGRSIRLAVFDEFALHPYGSENRQAVQAAVANSGGSIIITSTSNPNMGAAGAMYETWKRAEAGLGSLKPVFSGALCRPDQGQEFLDREMEDYEHEHIFRAHYPRTPEEAFMSRAGLVYGIDTDGVPIFDRSRNMKDPPVPWSDCHLRVVGIDLGGGTHPSAIVPLGLSVKDGVMHPATDRVHAYGPVYQKQGAYSVDEIHELLKELNAYGRISSVAVDPSQRAMILSLVQKGWPAEPAINDRSAILILAGAFKRGQLTIDPTDEGMLDEIMTTEWRQEHGDKVGSRRTNFATVTPKRHHADRLDAMRYAYMATRQHYPTVEERARKGRRRRLVSSDHMRSGRLRAYTSYLR